MLSWAVRPDTIRTEKIFTALKLWNRVNWDFDFFIIFHIEQIVSDGGGQNGKEARRYCVGGMQISVAKAIDT